ncbi:MAG: hypothetical protein JWQ90_4233 [Hydrocarboniphaga sp.]|uniref:outer membrane lipoprotein-sorting protein n=1 Tax=Hydrocarboniphaga sp. TaxID=2033016 RepID=UPI002625A0CC|nr:outer membrane lipoprotein-sorting protein [Hydrocarboniphaga sp.]MDB5971783.1 hypothetical protein [Hydrocarboniphaga sp.]
MKTKTGTVLRHGLASLLMMLFGSGAIAAGNAAAPSVEAIDSCMRANIPPALQIKQFTLNSTDRNGASRQLKGRLFAIRDEGLLRTMLRVDAPADLRGAAYLLREAKAKEQDAMYIFLPALNKTRRIMGGTQDNPLFGTDISYADIKQISHAFSGGHVVLEKTEQIESRDTYVLKLTPDAAQQSRFAEIRTWVDRESCVALRAEFIADQQVRKRYSASAKDLKKSGSRWYVSKGTMEDLSEHSHTELSIDGVIGSDGLSDLYFNPHSFQLGG